MSENSTGTRPTPPQDRARSFGTIPRGGPVGDRHELRVGLESRAGRDAASIRLWCEGPGGMWPSTRVGIQIRPRELPEVIRALTAIARELGVMPRDDVPSNQWRHYGGDGGPGRPDVSVDHTSLYAGRRQVSTTTPRLPEEL
jgi:hypothetical protein